MKARLEDKNKAIDLRRLGKSYREIQKEVGVSRGLLSGWLKDLRLTPEEAVRLEKRIEERKGRGRMASRVSNQARKIERERQTFKEAEKSFATLRKDPRFLMGVTLCWAEGVTAGSGFRFMNTDPDMVFVMKRWMERYLGVAKEELGVRLFIHKIPGYETVPDFWVKNLGIRPEQLKVTHYKAQNKAVRKGPGYKGCVQIHVGGVRRARLVKAWQTLCIQYYGNAIARS